MPSRRRTSTSDTHRSAHRRQQVRHNVQAFRQRERVRKYSIGGTEILNSPSNYKFSRASSNGSEPPWEALSLQTSSTQIDATVRVVEDGTIFSLKLPLKLRLGPDSLEVFVNQSEELKEDLYFSILMLEPSFSNSNESTFSNSNELCSNNNNELCPSNSNEPSLCSNNEPSLCNSNDSFLESSYQLIHLEPEQLQSVRVEIRCSGLKTDIDFTSSNKSSMLEEALIALALNMLGRERSDQQLLMQAMTIENQSLGQLKTGLRDFDQKICPEALKILVSTAMTLAVIELMVNSCEERLVIHLKGVRALMKHAESTTPLAEDVIESYGDIKLPFHTIDRKPNTPAERAPSESAKSPKKDEEKPNVE